MFAKVAILACLVALVVADGYQPSYDHYDNIDYKFNYDVKDDQHYNYQSRDEYKDGKNVYGSYSLVEPDGTTRIVKYTADDYGFHATVDHQGGYKQDYKQPSYGHQSHQPSYKQPSYGHQSYKQPSYKPSYQPSYQQPSYQPSYKQPSYKPSYQPSYHQPSYQPSYKQPSYQPSYKPSYQPSYHQPSYKPSYQSAY